MLDGHGGDDETNLCLNTSHYKAAHIFRFFKVFENSSSLRKEGTMYETDGSSRALLFHEEGTMQQVDVAVFTILYTEIFIKKLK